MKKITTLVLCGLMMGAISATFTSCNNTNNENSAESAPVKAASAKAAGYKIAYVQIDTLTSQYQKCKDLEEEFTKKRANAEATINTKGKNFTAQMQEFNRKYQSNQFTQQQFEAEQARLAKLQQDLQDLQARLSNSLQEEYQKEFQALTDTIQNFTKSYAKEKGYDFILCKSSGIDNVLYANEAYDVTEQTLQQGSSPKGREEEVSSERIYRKKERGLFSVFVECPLSLYLYISVHELFKSVQCFFSQTCSMPLHEADHSATVLSQSIDSPLLSLRP